MPKQIKIKRYRRMYRRYHSPSSLLIKGAGILLAVCVLAFIGWSAYGPIMDFLSGEPLSKPNEPAASSAAAAAPPVEEPEPEPEPVPAMPAQIQAVYAPVSALSSLEALDAFLDKITFTGVNALLLILKTRMGISFIVPAWSASLRPARRFPARMILLRCAATLFRKTSLRSAGCRLSATQSRLLR